MNEEKRQKIWNVVWTAAAAAQQAAHEIMKNNDGPLSKREVEMAKELRKYAINFRAMLEYIDNLPEEE